MQTNNKTQFYSFWLQQTNSNPWCEFVRLQFMIFIVCRRHETGTRRLWSLRRARHTRHTGTKEVCDSLWFVRSFVRVSRRSSYKHCFSEFWGIGFLKTWTKDLHPELQLVTFRVSYLIYLYRVFPYIFHIASFLQVEQKVRDGRDRERNVTSRRSDRFSAAQETQAHSIPSW